ncbi:MAG: helix-turn-helix domain-containing protein [Emergencia sp.]|nr:helix-turn-helix domain-containing protein [Emergencia sp.]
MDQKKIGRFIAECRKEKGLTQEQLGERLGVTYKAVSKWENGRNLPDPSLYNPLCRELAINLIELFDGERTGEDNVLERADDVIANLAQDSEKKTIYRAIAMMFTSVFIVMGVMLLFIPALKELEQVYAIVSVAAGLTFLFLGAAIKMYLWAKSRDKTIRNEGMGFCSGLTLVFITLKLTGNIDWSWSWVFAPVWMTVCGVILLMMVVLLFSWLKEKRQKNTDN